MFDFTNYPLNEYIQLCQQDHEDMIMNTQAGVGISKIFLLLCSKYLVFLYLWHCLAWFEEQKDSSAEGKIA